MSGALVELLARVLLAPTMVVGAGLLVKGYSAVGDGFTAGLVAALGILLAYVAYGHRAVRGVLPVAAAPLIALAGVFLAVLLAFLPPLWGDPLLTHYPVGGEEVVHLGTLELITAVAFDAGIFLFVLGLGVAAIDYLARTADEAGT